MGHEVAHATLQHGRERVSEGIATQAIGQGLGAAVNAADPRWTSAFNQLYSPATQLGLALPHSRAQESEADWRGLIYMAKAGYDPEASVAFWERFAAFNKQAGGGGTPWFLRTHPLDETRIKELKRRMSEAKAQFQPAK